VLLPGYLKEYAGIKRDVMVVGISNRIEVWAGINGMSIMTLPRDLLKK